MQEPWLKRPIVVVVVAVAVAVAVGVVAVAVAVVVVVFLSCLQLFAESDLVSRSKLTVLKSRYLDVSETDSVIQCHPCCASVDVDPEATFDRSSKCRRSGLPSPANFGSNMFFPARLGHARCHNLEAF